MIIIVDRCYVPSLLVMFEHNYSNHQAIRKMVTFHAFSIILANESCQWYCETSYTVIAFFSTCRLFHGKFSHPRKFNSLPVYLHHRIGQPIQSMVRTNYRYGKCIQIGAKLDDFGLEL